MIQNEIWIPILISVASLIMSITAFIKARPIEKQQYDSNALLECFRILGNIDLKTSKKNTAEERNRLLSQQKPIIFVGSVKKDADTLREAYNQVAALYQLGLLNRKHFKDVYGNAVVATWRMIYEDVQNDRKISRNPRLCLNLENLANDLIKEGINAEPY